ncbi:hypothetical protein BDV23DRAFT_162959 [Aspergillus alliaceus]|uniref:Uncharacterized protein n=1 Tax=Petromyces alliaceus TaxID=209559 RepID=A0A5N7BYB2_PETAA|nr:hypothetical protein BDV23DRAFT_162959 [Aspergillus alliaceus]
MIRGFSPVSIPHILSDIQQGTYLLSVSCTIPRSSVGIPSRPFFCGPSTLYLPSLFF